MNIDTTPLSRLENELLDQVLDDTASCVRPTELLIVWVDVSGRVQLGPVRWAHRNRNSLPGQCDTWSASPFPGGWSDVPRDRILRVRHPKAI